MLRLNADNGPANRPSGPWAGRKQDRMVTVGGFAAVFVWLLLCILVVIHSVALAADAVQPGQSTGLGHKALQVTPVSIIYQDAQGKKLQFPRSVFFDKTMDELYLISAGAENNMTVIGPDYFPYYSLGKGRGIERPSCVFVDANGNLYVGQEETDEKPGRLTILNAAFFQVKEIVFDDVAGVGDMPPSSVAVGRLGNIYVVSRSRAGLFIFDGQGKFVRNYIILDRKGGKKISFGDDPLSRNAVMFNSVAIDKRGRIYLVNELNSRIYVFDEEMKFLFHFGLKGGSYGKMSRPQDIALDEFRRLAYVVDYMRHVVLIYDMDDGRFIDEFGGQGWSPGWFNYPTSVTVGAGGAVVVADYFNNRVQVLDVR